MRLGFTPNAISNSSFSLPRLFTRQPAHPFSAQSSSTKITSSDSGVCMYPYISTPVPSPSFDFFLKIFINGSLFNFCWMLCFGQLDSSFLFCVLKPDTDSWLFMVIAVQILYSLDIAGFSICFCDFFFPPGWGLLKVVFFLWCCVGRKNSILRVRNIHQTSEPIPNSYLMASEQDSPEFNRNLYPHIEPYSTGFLKVSDLHTIYWEQSGNPNGHVSSNCFIGCLNLQNLFIVWSLTFETICWACMLI